MSQTVQWLLSIKKDACWFWIFVILLFDIVSDFDIRISYLFLELKNNFASRIFNEE
jgi:hypothetical protein